jgi:hypothetical protein
MDIGKIGMERGNYYQRNEELSR